MAYGGIMADTARLASLIKLQKQYAELYITSVMIQKTGEKSKRWFYEREAKKHALLFLGITERILWTLKTR